MQTHIKEKIVNGFVSLLILITLNCWHISETEAKLTPDVRAALHTISGHPPIAAVRSLNDQQFRDANVHLANILANSISKPLSFIATGALAGTTANNLRIVKAFIHHIPANGAIPAHFPSPLAGGNINLLANGGGIQIPQGPGGAGGPTHNTWNAGAIPNHAVGSVNAVIQTVCVGTGIAAPAALNAVPAGLGSALDQATIAAAKLIVTCAKAVESALADAHAGGHGIGAVLPNISGAAERAYNVYHNLSANITNNLNINNSRAIVLSFLNIRGAVNVGGAAVQAINVVGAAVNVPAGAPAISFNQARHLWEHEIERAHFWKVPIGLANVDADINYIAWNRAARIGEMPPQVHTSFVVPGGTSFEAHFLNILNNVHLALAHNLDHFDVSWDNVINGVNAVPTVAPVVVTDNIAIASSLSLHVDINGVGANHGTILKTALIKAVSGNKKISNLKEYESSPSSEAMKSLEIANKIISTMSLPISVSIEDDETVRCSLGKHTPDGSFANLTMGGGVADNATALAPHAILIGINQKGEIRTMFAE